MMPGRVGARRLGLSLCGVLLLVPYSALGERPLLEAPYVRTPQPVVDRLSTEISTVLRQPELKATLATNGYEPVGSTPAALRTHIDAEINRWSKVVKDSGAQIQ